MRIALANLPFPTSPEHSVQLAEQAIAQAAIDQAEIAVSEPPCASMRFAEMLLA
ncbi:MAG: hypothetical protein NTV70_25135 [Acidobacteria bacterium]|nr:hypothetical protein [Acidobacteriota bacterium]